MIKRHTCKVLVITCIEFRFVTKVRDFLLERTLKDNYDLITTPGASLGVKQLSSSIATSIKLHGPEEIYIFDHEDCGAYGKNNSESAHTENLKIARDLINREYPGKKIKTYFVGFNKLEEIY